MDRRRFVHLLASSTAFAIAPGRGPSQPNSDTIDRRSVVSRHSPRVRTVDPFSVLSVGNGRFAFTADVTGLQSFPEAYQAIPLATQAEWGWHSFPNPDGYTLEDATTTFATPGGPVPYADLQHSRAGAWLRQNPHRLSLARIGFDLGENPDRLSEIDQKLDLWSGTLHSRFRVDGVRVQVHTAVHPQRDIVAIKVEAVPNVDSLSILITFPYGSPDHTGDPGRWMYPDLHRSNLVMSGRQQARLDRVLDDDSYVVRARWSAGRIERSAAHSFTYRPESGADSFWIVFDFSPELVEDAIPAADEVLAASASHWNVFWQSGGAIDFSAVADPRARELERRVVLSQYLTAIQCSGTMPPQETGLTFNSWHGKFHLEMHWWHAVHFALWNRMPLLERSLQWYMRILPSARETARRQGYRGVRWPKMVGPDGRESPSTIGVFLIWQQPHPIYFSELLYRAYPERAVLETYRELVFESAEFMASFARWDGENDRYVLGPPLIPAQEIHPPETTLNPTFELAYWRWGLNTAQRWRERLGLPRRQEWDDVLTRLAPLPMNDGLYVNAESDLETFRNSDRRRDHPTLLAACGFLPPDGVDTRAMRATLRRVLGEWRWDETWGWDYPLTAMTAARLGMPEEAVDVLLMDTPKNHYHPNGHNYQREGLTIYLPGNGGLLAAVAMMAAGWTGAPAASSPGFPESWTVRSEGLRSFI